MIALTHEPIDTSALLASVSSNDAGAIVLFLGVTRERTRGKQTLWLDYDSYEPMAREKIEELATEATSRWSLTGCAIVHRLGRVDISEASVAIAASSPHRNDAFEAAKWLIDTLKENIPIWKQEHWADGSTEWVHPK